MQSGPLHRTGSSGEASFPAVGVAAENMALLPRNLDTNDGQAGREAAEQQEAAERWPSEVAGRQPPLRQARRRGQRLG